MLRFHTFRIPPCAGRIEPPTPMRRFAPTRRVCTTRKAIACARTLALDVQDVVRLTNLSRAKIYSLWAQGKGPPRLKIGKRTLVLAPRLSEWMASHEVPPNGSAKSHGIIVRARMADGENAQPHASLLARSNHNGRTVSPLRGNGVATLSARRRRQEWRRAPPRSRAGDTRRSQA